MSRSKTEAETPTADGQSPRRIRNISELAKLAGVSAGTVSRALAGKALVNPKTRARIQELARLHDFRPNQMASRLRTQRTGVIGVVIPLGHEQRQHISDPFFMTMLGYLADHLTENGYDLMLSRVIPDTEDWLERIAESGMLDGVILIGQSNQFAAIERVAARYRPLVVWGGHQAGQTHCSVGSDNWAGGHLAGQHLARRGVKRVAFLGDPNAPEAGQRYEGFRVAFREAGITAEPVIISTHFAADSIASDIAAQIGQLKTGIDGIFAASDVIAMTALRVLADHNLSVPGDMALIGFDDLPIATQTVPRLTTISQDIERGARELVDALFTRINGTDSPSVIMEPALVERDSA